MFGNFLEVLVTIASEENVWDSLSLSLNQWQNSQDPLQFMSYSQATCFHEDRLQNEHATTILEVVTHSDPSGLQYRNP